MAGQRAGPQDRASAAAASHARLENFAALLSWIDSLGSVGLDGQDLTEVGLKNGIVVVDDLRNGVRSKFERINLSLTRPRAGELALRMGSDDPDRPWVLGAEIRPTLQGSRAVALEARKVSLQDLLLALRIGEGQIAGDLPISGSLRAEIGADGRPQFATGRMLVGPGEIGESGDPSGLLAIDRGELSLEWDSVRRVLAAPFQIVAGGARLTLIAQAEAPPDPGGVWNVGLRGGTIMLPASAPNEPGMLLNRIGMRGRFDPVKRRLDIDQADIGGKDVGVAMSGSVDFSTPDPRLAIGIAARNMSASAFKQLWPVFVNPKVREWVLENMSGGAVERVEIATNAPLSTLKSSGPPIPDDGLSIQVVTSGTTVRAVESLPPIRDADLVTRVRGRSVTITLGRGVVETPGGRKITLVNGVFEVPDTFGNKPPARARARVESAVPAIAELLAMERLRQASGAPLDPAASRGTISAQVSLAMPLDPDLPKGAVNYSIAADVTNFAVEKFVLSQRIEAQMLRVTANTQGYALKGDVRIGGTPASIEYRKPAGEEEAEIRLQATFDDAARARLGIDLHGAVTGPVPLKLAGRMAATSEQDSRFTVDADLTSAKVDGLLPGWIKPAGKATRATFNYVGRGKAARFDDLVIEGAGASVKGAVELDVNGDIVNATFPVFGLAESDKASLKAERTPEGVLKVVMRGDVYDGRGFIKSAMGGTKPDAKERKSIADLDLDLKIGALAGFNGEALRGLDLRLVRREGRIRNFSLNAKLGVDTPLIGDLRGRQNRTVVYFETADAGALFRFTDTYARMVGGSMWMAMDPPTIDHAPQEGLLNVRDFAVRGEPALERVAGGGGSGGQSSVEFSRMRVEFVRLSGRMNIKEGLVRGPAVGATIDGHIDYAGNEIRMRGTFVPLYGLNNALNQIPIVGLFLGGSNEGLVGITYEVVGTPGSPVLRVNPISAVAPGILRKFFEFPSSGQAERFNDLSIR